jgi:hypothetical protein
LPWGKKAWLDGDAMKQMKVLLVIVAVGIALTTRPVYAHGFGERYDLPVPLWLYLVGAGVAVALSFAVIGFFVRGTSGLHDYPRINLLRWHAGRALIHPAVVLPIKVASVSLFVLVILAGLIGDPAPLANLAPTVVWVIWWVGFAYVSSLVGNVWALINPWKITFEWAEGLYRRLDPEGELSFRVRYPDQLGVWPGLFLFLGFAWAEIVYAESAFPARIAQMGLLYSLIAWAGMIVFGKEQWLRYGEAFSLAFGLLARFAPTEVRVVDQQVCDACEVQCLDLDGHCIGCGNCFRRASTAQRELNLRPFAVGLLRHESVSPSMLVFVVLLLSTVTFDGFTATPLWSDIQSSLYATFPNLTTIGSFGLVVFPMLFITVYLGFSALMAAASGNRLSISDMARAFVYSLVPIALAYHLAHFLSFLLIQGQLIIPLASDPFGFEWDLFGTADYRINIAIVNARFAWFTAVGAIVVGHIIAVYLAHTIALRTLREHQPALRSQYPMLGLMVGYTMVSLWIIAQPIVETAPKG